MTVELIDDYDAEAPDRAEAALSAMNDLTMYDLAHNLNAEPDWSALADDPEAAGHAHETLQQAAQNLTYLARTAKWFTPDGRKRTIGQATRQLAKDGKAGKVPAKFVDADKVLAIAHYDPRHERWSVQFETPEDAVLAVYVVTNRGNWRYDPDLTLALRLARATADGSFRRSARARVARASQ